MSKVREIQPLVPSSLTSADISKILNRQTSVVLQSQTVMFEVLTLNDSEQPDNDVDPFYWDTNYYEK